MFWTLLSLWGKRWIDMHIQYLWLEHKSLSQKTLLIRHSIHYYVCVECLKFQDIQFFTRVGQLQSPKSSHREPPSRHILSFFKNKYSFQTICSFVKFVLLFNTYNMVCHTCLQLKIIIFIQWGRVAQLSDEVKGL